MDLEKVIAQLEAQDQQKTAAMLPSSSVDARLQGALAETLEKTAASVTPPTASEDPVTGLMKMASELAGAEKEAELALANMLGQAFADGAIAKFAAYDAHVKIAMAQQQNTESPAESFYKESEDDTLVKMAADQGYNDAMSKVADAQFEQGFNEQVTEIHNTAYGEFLKGAAETEVLLNAVRAQQ